MTTENSHRRSHLEVEEPQFQCAGIELAHNAAAFPSGVRGMAKFLAERLKFRRDPVRALSVPLTPAVVQLARWNGGQASFPIGCVMYE